MFFDRFNIIFLFCLLILSLCCHSGIEIVVSESAKVSTRAMRASSCGSSQWPGNVW